MIKRNTVLILGAGASIPYGYPSGRELKNKISKSLDDSSWMEVFNRRGVSRLVGQFKDQITYSGRTSVDAFLEYRKEFLEIGKMAIALALIPFEDEKRLFDHNRTVRNWYEYLFNKMSEGVAFSELPSNCISIITFNYDRSLEQYLFTSIGNSYGESPEHCKSVMKQFPIIHLHGSLG